MTRTMPHACSHKATDHRPTDRQAQVWLSAFASRIASSLSPSLRDAATRIMSEGVLPEQLAALSVAELVEFSRFLKWSHHHGFDTGELPEGVPRDPDVAYGDDWDGWISFYIMSHANGPPFAAAYYLDHQRRIPPDVYRGVELRAPDDSADIERRMKRGATGSG